MKWHWVIRWPFLFYFIQQCSSQCSSQWENLLAAAAAVASTTRFTITHTHTHQGCFSFSCVSCAFFLVVFAGHWRQLNGGRKGGDGGRKEHKTMYFSFLLDWANSSSLCPLYAFMISFTILSPSLYFSIYSIQFLTVHVCVCVFCVCLLVCYMVKMAAMAASAAAATDDDNSSR